MNDSTMTERILDIREITDHKDKDHYGNYDGYMITTTQQEIFIGISNGQSCCERWGYFIIDEDYKWIVTTELLGIEVVDQVLDVTRMTDVYEGGAIFVNILTNQGMIQIVVYNAHNGYYGHSVIIRSKQLILDDGV